MCKSINTEVLMLTAIRQGNKNRLKNLIKAYGSLKSDAFSERLLYCAIKKNQSKIIKLLFHHNCRVNSIVKNSHTCLNLAVRKGNSFLVKYLLKKGASANALNAVRCSPLIMAVKYGSSALRIAKMCKILLRFGAETNISDKDGETVLEIAIKRGYYDVAELLLRNNADFSEKTKHDISLTFLCALKGYEQLFILLCNYGALFDVHERKDDKTILDHAVAQHCPVIVEYVLKNRTIAQENIHDLFITAVLDFRCRTTRIIKLFYEYGCPFNAKDMFQENVVLAVMKLGLLNIFEDILKHGFDVRTLVENDRSFCRESFHLGCALFNDDNNFRHFEELNYVKRCTSFLHVAVLLHNSQLVEALLERGADVSSQDENGFTPVQTAVIISFHRNSIKEFVKFDTDLDCRGKNQMTALHLAAYTSDNGVFLALLESGSDINIVDENNLTVLNYIEKSESKYGFYRCKNTKLRRILQTHIVKLRVARCFLTEPFLKLRINLVTASFKKDCQIEIASMRRTKVCDSPVSYYNIFMSTSSKVATYLRNKSFLCLVKLGPLKKMFPIYGRMVYYKLVRAESKRKLLDNAGTTFSDIFPGLPENCIEKVVSYLTNEDLRRIIMLW